MAWSFGDDSHEYAHIMALQAGYKSAKAPAKRRTNAEAEHWPLTWRYVGHPRAPPPPLKLKK